VGVAAVVPPAQAAFPGRDGLLAMSIWRDCGSRIALMRPDGSARRWLTRATCDDTGRTHATAADWAPDGRRLLIESEGVYLPRQVAVMPPDGSRREHVPLGLRPNRLAPGVGFPRIEALRPSFAPDGRRFVYTRSVERFSGIVSDLWVARLDGSGHRRLRRARSARWSPDGRHIAYVTNNATLGIATISGERVRLLARQVGAVDWSPDGRQLVFTSYSDGDVGVDDVFVVGVDGGEPRQLTFTPHVAETSVAWAPSGRRFAFTQVRSFPSREQEQGSVWTMDPDGGGLRQIYQQPRQLHEDPDLGAPGLSWQPR
jgi:Tol biopolymer transport system component